MKFVIIKYIYGDSARYYNSTVMSFNNMKSIVDFDAAYGYA